MAIKVFVSYSHADEDQKSEFVKYLKLLERQGKATLWTDGALQAGTEWDPQIKQALEEAEIILILVTVNALISDYISNIEMKRAYEKYAEGTARVICIIMEDCPWENTPVGAKNPEGKEYLLKNFQAVKPHGKPIYSSPNLAAAMTEAYKQIERSIDHYSATKAPSKP